MRYQIRFEPDLDKSTDTELEGRLVYFDESNHRVGTVNVRMVEGHTVYQPAEGQSSLPKLFKPLLAHSDKFMSAYFAGWQQKTAYFWIEKESSNGR